MSEWHFGRMGRAGAVVAGGRLRVRVDGMRPAPDVEVRLAPYPHDPDSSADVQLGLYWRMGAESDAPAPFTAHAEVDLGGEPAPTVRIYHASGYQDVPVRHGPREGGNPASPA